MATPIDPLLSDPGPRPLPRAGAATPLSAQRLKALSFGFARGLAKWRTGAARGLIEMRNILACVAGSLDEPAARALWRTALAWLDAPAAHAHADLLDGLAARLALLAAGAAPADAPAALMRSLLRGIAGETRRAACRAPLAAAREAWEGFAGGTAIALMGFHDAALLLAAAARDSGDAEFVRLAAAIADCAAWLRRGPDRADQALIGAVAAALALAEEAVGQEHGGGPAFAAAVTARIDRLAALGAVTTVPPAPTSSGDLPRPAEEARDHLAALGRQLGGPAAVPAAGTIHAARAIAEQAGGAGFPPVQALARALEHALLRHAQVQAAPDEPARMLLARAVGALDGMVGAIAEGRRPADENALATALDALRPAADPRLLGLFVAEADELLDRLAGELRAWRAEPARAETGRRVAHLLHTFKGDARMGGALDLGALAHEMEAGVAHVLAEGGADAAAFDALDAALDRARREVAELRRQAGRAAPRRIDAAERLRRVVRRTAGELDRLAELDIQGDTDPVARDALERLRGPLEHLLRNAVAHGIEAPAARRAAGKPDCGRIALTLAAGEEGIALTLADDGRGLDFAAIRARALASGLPAPDAADTAALAELIFHPGLSTAAAVDEIAGRGIGLDAVRTEIAGLGGRVEAGSRPGGGTRFHILLPPDRAGAQAVKPSP